MYVFVLVCSIWPFTYHVFNCNNCVNVYNTCVYLQEDLTSKDVESIIDDLKNGKTPTPGPR